MRFRHDNSIKHLIDFIKPENKNYMILESLNQMKDNNNYKSIHVVTLEPGNKIVMGRGHDADMRINDISVSRLHGTICLEPDSNKILLKDLGSKFGTLALIQNDFVITNKKVCLQIGRSYLECKVGPYSEIIQEKDVIDENLVDEKLRQFHASIKSHQGVDENVIKGLLEQIIKQSAPTALSNQIQQSQNQRREDKRNTPGNNAHPKKK